MKSLSYFAMAGVLYLAPDILALFAQILGAPNILAQIDSCFRLAGDSPSSMCHLGSWIVEVDSCLDSSIAGSGVDSTDIVAGHYN